MNLETGEPLDELTDLAKDWCKKHGVKINTVSEFLEKKDEKLMKAIQDGIDRYNSRAISRAQKVYKHRLYTLLHLCPSVVFHVPLSHNLIHLKLVVHTFVYLVMFICFLFL